MRRRLLSTILGLGLAVFAASAAAAPAVPIDVRAGPLDRTLGEVARQTGAELLFDRQLVRGLTGRAIRGRLTPEAALGRLLAGTGVGYRITPEGAFVLFPAPGPAAAAEPGDGAIAELLVVGRRSQNVDIRRSGNDIQPYRLLGRREIEGAARSNLDELLRVRESANTRAGSLNLVGETRSSIDLRGFGESSTLVLVDGRRMPFVPAPFGAFLQADINGVPLGAVERVEVLTTTAGGIHGLGATGGVVNVILRRDYRGADLTVQGGVTDRGDAGEGRVEGRVGFTPNDGRTDVMLFVSEARAAPLRVGDRSYLERASRRLFANHPDAYVADFPVRNGVAVSSLEGDLTLDPAWGGAAVGSRYTYLPLGFSGSRADAAALLVANAGKLPQELTDDLVGERADLTARSRLTSGLVSVRHRLTPGLEIFADGIYAHHRGKMSGAALPDLYRLAAGNIGNPFGQAILLAFPQPVLETHGRYDLDIRRGTVGLIADLPGGWKAAADYTSARSAYVQRVHEFDAGLAGAVSGRPSPVAGPVDPFGDWAAVLAALPAYVEESRSGQGFHGGAWDASLRLAGPVAKLPGGPLTATLLAEHRRDRFDDYRLGVFGLDVPMMGRDLEVRSAYGELRAPLGAAEAANPLLRGLEAQLAIRHDHAVQRGPTEALSIGPTERFTIRNGSTTFTAGARLSPTETLMLRASFSTGDQPPTLADLQRLSSDLIFINGPPDPLRGGRPVGTETPVEMLVGGSLRVRSAHARSTAVGVVFNPGGGERPRLSLDYSRIEVTGAPMSLPADAPALLAAEGAYPDRVIRIAPTEADLAAGFTVGPVVRMDFASANEGRILMEAVDARLDWRLPDRGIGDIRLYGNLTWQPTFKQTGFGGATVNRVNALNGPLAWRGNGGVEWGVGDTVADLNLQVFGRHRISDAGADADTQASDARAQGARRVPAQVYVDLSVRRRFRAPRAFEGLGAIDARVSVLNLLDHAPPLVATDGVLGFSRYGDPRRRRVVFSLAARF